MSSKHIAAIVSAFVAFAVYASDEVDKWGGEITVWPDNHGVFYFVNAQTTVSEAALAKPIEVLGNSFNIDIRFDKGARPEIGVVASELKNLDAKGGIWIVDDPAWPLVLAAVEDGWAFLNVAPIVADKPNDDLLGRRLTKVFNRLFAYVNGGYESTMMPGCVLKPAFGMKEIDALTCKDFSPEAQMKISGFLSHVGYLTRKRGLYYDACEEGWAPAPTNAVQQAIWDEVHRLPTKPMKILPPSKKSK